MSSRASARTPGPLLSPVGSFAPALRLFPARRPEQPGFTTPAHTRLALSGVRGGEVPGFPRPSFHLWGAEGCCRGWPRPPSAPQICSQALAAIPWVLGTAAVERAGHGGLTCFALLFAPQAALKKYQAEQRGKGDTLDKCQAELKKLRKKSQGSKNPQKYSDKELQVGCCGPRAPAPPRGWGGRVLCVPHPHGGSRAAPPGEIGQPSSRPGGFRGRPLACAGSLSRAPEGSLPKEQSPRGNLFLSRPSGFPPQTDPRLFL